MDKNFLTAIIEFLPDATFVVDNTRKVVAWNGAIERMTGTNKSDILGRGGYAIRRKTAGHHSREGKNGRGLEKARIRVGDRVTEP